MKPYMRQKPLQFDTTKLYETWSKNKSPSTLIPLMDHLKPTAEKAIRAYSKPGSPVIRSEAKRMMIEGIEKYDPTRGAALESYLMNHMRGLRRVTGKASRILNMPERMAMELGDLGRAEQELQDEYGTYPSDQALTDKLGISAKRLADLRKYRSMPMVESSFMTPREGAAEESVGLPGVVGGDRENMLVDYLYYSLDPTNKKIVDWKLGRYGQPVMSNMDIAKKLGMSPAAVTQRAEKIAIQLEQLASQF